MTINRNNKFNLFTLLLITVFIFNAARANANSGADESEISFSLLGFYKKIQVYKDEIQRFSQKYGIDSDLAIAITMYESGANKDLTSSAGAKGLMQVMPSTKRYMQTNNDIEAGIKYLANLQKIFGNQPSQIIIAYNGGPSAVTKNRLRLETVQYLNGVSLFYHLLKTHSSDLEEQIANLRILEVQNENWEDLANKLNISIIELRIFNPFLAHKDKLKANDRVTYPLTPLLRLKKENENYLYKARKGDIYHLLAIAFGMEYSSFRELNNVLTYGNVLPGDFVKIALPQQLLPKNKD